MIDLNAVMPESIHRFCRWLIDHMDPIYEDKGSGLDIRLNMRATAKLGTEESEHIRFMADWLDAQEGRRAAGQNESFDILIMQCLGLALKIGPKVFGPSPDLCSTLEQHDISVPPQEFLVPFPVFFVEYPKAWAAQLAEEKGGRVPWFGMVGNFRPGGYFSYVVCHGTTHEEDEGVVINCRGQDTFQRAFDDSLDIGREKLGEYPTPLQYVAHQVNFNIGFLGHSFGTKDLGWADPEARRRHERMTSRRGKTLRTADPRRVVINPAHLVFFPEVRHRPSGEGQGEGYRRPSRGHYVRGHYWACPVGPRSEGRHEYRPRRGHWRGRRIEGEEPRATLYVQK
ncbi:MAG: hypothetical protein BGO49_20255 [Planctomycetales bacterium 71-10]|nr:MAG: hypothetical protein BGO49_20255 [Planctomycetales bacterium 71-10]